MKPMFKKDPSEAEKKHLKILVEQNLYGQNM